MVLKIVVSCRDTNDYKKIEIDGEILEPMRGGAEEKVVELKELIESLNNEIAGNISEPCEVTMELSGTTTYGGGGRLKALIINISGKTEKTTGVKITLTTKIKPRK